MHWLWSPGAGAIPAHRRPRNRNKTPQFLFSILVDTRRDGATITVTCGHKLKASDTTIPVSLGELSKHRPCWRSFRGSGLFTGCERQWIECHALCCWCTPNKNKTRTNLKRSFQNANGGGVTEWPSRCAPARRSGQSRRCRHGSPCLPKSFATNGHRPACASCGELDGSAQRLANGLDSVGPHHDECKDGKFETGMSRMRGFLR